MGKVEYTKKLLGNLVKQARAASMDQEELALSSMPPFEAGIQE